MKVLILLFSALTLSAQVTFNIQITGDVPVAVTQTAEGISSAINAMMLPLTGVPTVTLTSPATNAQTTLAVSSIPGGITTCMGFVTATEMSLITGISGGVGGGTLTVTRGAIGTTKAAYLSGQSGYFTSFGQGSCVVAWLYAGWAQGTIILTPGPLVQAQNAAIAAATAAIATHKGAAVTRVP